MKMTRRSLLVPVVLAAAIPVAAAVAYAFGQPPAYAALGAALVFVYWLLQTAFNRFGMRGTPMQGIAVGVGGVAVRIMFVLIVLVGIALVSRTAFLVTAISFLAVYAVYLLVNFTLVVK